jgi:hypothetical protein
MLAPLPDGQLRIDVAQEVLTDLVANQIPAGVPVALRVFGTTPDSCETSLLVPPSPLDPDAMAATIQAIEPVNLVKTPLGASLERVADDLAGVDGPKVVVLVTDGEETCGGDPAESIRSLAGQGIDVQVNIVGFALDDDALRAQFGEWAELGNGTYFDATSADELDDAIGRAVQAPFQVIDADGVVVASGTVGGNPVDVPAGTYTVVVLTDPEVRLEDVTVGEDEDVELALPGPDRQGVQAPGSRPRRHSRRPTGRRSAHRSPRTSPRPRRSRWRRSLALAMTALRSCAAYPAIDTPRPLARRGRRTRILVAASYHTNPAPHPYHHHRALG